MSRSFVNEVRAHGRFVALRAPGVGDMRFCNGVDRRAHCRHVPIEIVGGGSGYFAAASITRATAAGWDMKTAWLALTSVTFAPER